MPKREDQVGPNKRTFPVKPTKGRLVMHDHHEANDLPGYNPGAADVAKSPITMDDLKELKASCFFTDEDVLYLPVLRRALKIGRVNGRKARVCRVRLETQSQEWISLGQARAPATARRL